MKDKLEKHIIQRIGKAAQGIDLVLDSFRENYLPKSKTVLMEGEVCRDCFFITEGCFQIYRIDQKGNQVTTGLIFGLGWYTVMDSFKHKTPSIEGIRTIEDTAFLSISKENFDDLSSSVPEFQTVYQKMLEDAYVESLNRINLLMSLDTQGKLKWLDDHHPKILSRLNSKDIASFLGVSPETLSRAKAKFYKS